MCWPGFSRCSCQIVTELQFLRSVLELMRCFFQRVRFSQGSRFYNFSTGLMFWASFGSHNNIPWIIFLWRILDFGSRCEVTYISLNIENTDQVQVARVNRRLSYGPFMLSLRPDVSPPFTSGNRRNTVGVEWRFLAEFQLTNIDSGAKVISKLVNLSLQLSSCGDVFRCPFTRHVHRKRSCSSEHLSLCFGLIRGVFFVLYICQRCSQLCFYRTTVRRWFSASQ